ncbi:hypothetical protein N665_1221s0003, partial [Sinapis alba]
NYAGHSTISETPQNHQGSETLRTNRESCTNGCDHTSTNAPDPIRTPQLSVLGREYKLDAIQYFWVFFFLFYIHFHLINSAVKRAWARVVLGWVTSREVLVLHPFLFFFSIGKRLNFETP